MTTSISSPGQRARRLRIVAVFILLLGIAGAEVVYLFGNEPGRMPDDPSLLGYDKAQARQVGTLYGQQGVIAQEWSDELKQPRTQAIIILGIAGLAAGACLYVAGQIASNSTMAE
jgi:hypothetical protein